MLIWFVSWPVAVLGVWDRAALAFLVTVCPIIIRADDAHVRMLGTREDETRGSGADRASLASLLSVGFALGQAGRESGAVSMLFTVVAVLTVALSWMMVNTVYTLHYAHL